MKIINEYLKKLYEDGICQFYPIEELFKKRDINYGSLYVSCWNILDNCFTFNGRNLREFHNVQVRLVSEGSQWSDDRGGYYKKTKHYDLNETRNCESVLHDIDKLKFNILIGSYNDYSNPYYLNIIFTNGGKTIQIQSTNYVVGIDYTDLSTVNKETNENN